MRSSLHTLSTFRWLIAAITGGMLAASVMVAFSVWNTRQAMHSERELLQQAQAQIHRKLRLHDELQGLFGYGGFIHHFKDYVLRGTPEIRAVLEADSAQTARLMQIYQGMARTDEESAALGQIEQTRARYHERLNAVAEAWGKGLAVRDIDALAQIDDAPALAALDVLQRSLDQEITRARAGLARQSEEIQRFFSVTLWSFAGLIGVGVLTLFLLQRLAVELRTRRRQARELSLGEARYRGILDTAVDAIITIDEQGLIEQANPAAERMFGISAADMEGRNIKMLMPEPDASRHDGYLRAYLHSGQARIIGIGRQVTAMRKGGETFPAELAVSEVVLDGQRLFTGTLRDISARVMMEQELLRQKALFAGIFNDSPDALAVADQNHRLLMCNPAFYRLFEYLPSEVLGRPVVMLYESAAEYARHEQLQFNSQSGEKRGPDILNYKTKNRRIFPGETGGSALHDQHGAVKGYLYAIRDITERQRAESALKNSQANLAEAQRIANLGSWEWDIVNDRLSWSDQVYRIFNIPPQSFKADSQAFMTLVHPDDAAKVHASEARAFRGQGHNVEHRIVWPSGTVRWVHELAEVSFDEHGKPVRMAGTAQDITERKLNEAAIQRQTASLKALNEIAANSHLDARKQLQQALQLSARHLELEIGIISHIDDQRYIVEHHVAPADMELADGQVFELGSTYCDLSMRSKDVIAIEAMGKSTYAGHPCYRKFQLETYIGAPFVVRGSYYGTVNFSSPRAYHRNFDEGDREFVRMLARWCGSVLERALAYEDLRISEERLQRSQTFANIGTWDWNIQNGDLFWSERIGPLFGYAPGKLETTYENFLNAIHPEDRQAVIDAVNACVGRSAEYNIEHRAVWPDGTVRWLLEKGDVVRAEDGTPLKMLGVVQDITQRRQYQEELARFRQVIDSSNQAIGIADLQGTLVYINQAHRDLLHDPDGSVIGRDWRELVPAAAVPAVESIIGAINAGQGWRGLLPINTLDGHEFVSYSNVDLVLDERGAAQFVFNIFYDYSDELKRQSEIQQAREQAEKANRAKSEFLSSMSHELRTPLNSILGFAQLLEKGRKEPLSARQLSHVQHILKSGRHLLVLINEVLDLAKIEAGRISVSLENVELRGVIEESLNLVASLAHERDIRLDTPPKQAASVYVQADRTRLRQVVLNLLSNAIKYNCEHGEVRIGCEITGEHLRLSVSDTGAGISAQDRPHLFEPFNRLSAENSEVEGTGVGLALSKKLIELMGGQIGCDSTPGQGATFWIELPAQAAASEKIPLPLPPAEASPMPEQHPPGNDPDENTQPGPKRLVLYVEDNPANLFLMSEIIKHQANVELLSAPTAELGLLLARERRPHLIILDINLPGMNGIEAVRELKAHDSTRAIPVIALSADAMPNTIHKAMNAGFDRYMTKPMDIPELMEVLRSFLENADD